MKAMKERTAEAGELLHAMIAPRVYEGDWSHGERIDKTRALVAKTNAGTIIELGCGTADICGHFADNAAVWGYDCNEKALVLAMERYPSLEVGLGIPEPRKCDCLILCEYLEHIPNPIEVIQAWLPLAKFSVISHPLDEELDSNLSAGEHQWSFDMEDFERWFTLGGHKLVEMEVFDMPHKCILGLGERI